MNLLARANIFNHYKMYETQSFSTYKGYLHKLEVATESCSSHLVIYRQMCFICLFFAKISGRSGCSLDDSKYKAEYIIAKLQT